MPDPKRIDQLPDAATLTGAEALPLVQGGGAKKGLLSAVLAYVAANIAAPAWSAITGKPAFGTAATKDTGTGAGQVPVLADGGKLPALDGSQLTNLPASSAPANVTGLRYGNGTNPDTAASGAQVAGLLANQAIAPSAVTTDAGSTGAAAVAVGAANTGLCNLGGQLAFVQGGMLRAYFDNSNRLVAAGNGIASFGDVQASGTLKPGSYTLSTLPSASSTNGCLAYVSNPAAGKRGDVFSNGTNWLYPDNSIAA